MRTETRATVTAAKAAKRKAARGVALKMAAFGVALATLAPRPALAADVDWIITAPVEIWKQVDEGWGTRLDGPNPQNMDLNMGYGENNSFLWHEYSMSALIPATGWIQSTVKPDRAKLKPGQSAEKLELTCEWQHASPPPPTLTLLIKSSLSSSARYDVNKTEAVITAELENGFGAVLEKLPDENPSAGATLKRWQARSKILLTFSTAGAIEDAGSGKWRLQVPIKDIKLKLSTIYKPLGADRSLVTLTMRGDEFSVKTDNRRVTLTRNGAPEPKRWDDTDLDKEHDEWMEANGTRHGHTRLGYYERVDTTSAGVGSYADNQVPVSQVIGAQIAGDWSADTAYTWSPDPDARDTKTSHIANMPNTGGTFNPDGIGWDLSFGPKSVYSKY